MTHVSFHNVNPFTESHSGGMEGHQIGIDGSGHLYTAGQNGLTRHDLAGFTHGDLWNHSNTDCGISATATAPFDLNSVPLNDICDTLDGRFAVNLSLIHI